MADVTFMADGAFDQSGKGSAPERRSWSASTLCCACRSSSAAITRVRSVRASSISLSGESLPARSCSRNSRNRSTRHFEASAADGRIAPEICEQQRSYHRSHRNRSIECLSAYSKKAWLSRIENAAHFKFRFSIPLIACWSPNWCRFTTFWFPVASARSACR